MKAEPVFTKETFQFFRELGRNNHKPWMDANRHRYQAHIVAPLRTLLEQLSPVVHRLDSNFDVVGRTVSRVTPAEHAANYQATRDALGKGKAKKPAAKQAKGAKR